MRELGVEKSDIIELIGKAYSCPGPLFRSRAKLERELKNFHVKENQRILYGEDPTDSLDYVEVGKEFIRRTLYSGVLDRYYSNKRE